MQSDAPVVHPRVGRADDHIGQGSEVGVITAPVEAQIHKEAPTFPTGSVRGKTMAGGRGAGFEIMTV